MNIIDGQELIGSQPSVDIVFDEGAWPDLAERKVHYASSFAIAALTHGMQGGRVSVALRIDLQDGTTVFCESSMRLFLTTADALRARFGESQRFVEFNKPRKP